MTIRNLTSVRLLSFSFFIFIVATFSPLVTAVTLESINPPTQRVHEFVEIRGNGFGTSQGDSLVRFISGGTIIEAGTAYVWRDNYIRIRVPVGNRIGGVNTLIPKNLLVAQVQVGSETSNSLPFQVISDTTSALEFRQMTSIDASHVDTSIVLGSPNMNLARTKDAEIGDVNRDGFMDIIDNNSQNEGNNSHSVLRINNQDKTFRAIPFEPLTAADAGEFAATIPPDHEYFGDGVSYDADFVDFNNDGLPDYLHTASMGGGTNRVRLFLNNASNPGTFTEVTNTWLSNGTFLEGQFPDDLDHIDINNDGFVDFAVTLRKRNELVDASITKIFLNNNGTSFSDPFELAAPSGISTHDVFFMDANNDGYQDIVLCNETSGASTQLYFNSGDATNPYGGVVPIEFNFNSTTGSAADFNGNGLEDFVLAFNGVRVYLNDSTDPGTFTSFNLPGSGGGTAYDIELGDVNLDGHVDIIAAIIVGDADNAIKVWLNNGDGTFSHWTEGGASTQLPGLGDYQRLSADLLDLDNDGDLDLYVTGADGQDVGHGGNGKVPNQLFENLTKGFNIVTPTQVQTAFGGNATQGQKVMVRIHSNVPIPSVTPASFQVSIGSVALPDSDINIATQIEEEYWLLVQAPEMSTDCYDLEISLSADPAIRDIEPDSICYGENRTFARALAIDRTNSMNRDSFTSDNTGEKMQAARAAAKIFVNLSMDQDQIGITSFKRDSDDGDGVVEQNELARTDFAMVQAMNGGVDQRPIANGVIDTPIQPDGMNFALETSIGAGLLQAFNMVDSVAIAGHEREIILLSDGRENYQPYWLRAGAPGPVAPTILGASPDVTVHTVALGRDANIEVLQDIAQQTGGTFHNLYEGSGSFFLLSRLANTYKFIDEIIRDEQRFFYKEDLPTCSRNIPIVQSVDSVVATASRPGNVSATAGCLGEIRVENGFESISLAFHWNIDNAVEDVLLIDPDGNQVNPSSDVTRHIDNKHIVYRFKNPKAGIWRYRVAQTNIDMEFFATASGISNLVMKTAPSVVKSVSPGSFEVPIRVVLADHKPIALASIQGTITRPDKSKISVELHDDGMSNDGVKGDGVYGVIYNGNQVGGYQVDLKGTGVTSLNEPFERRTMLSFVFPSGNPDRDGEGDRISDPNLPDEDKLNDRFYLICVFLLIAVLILLLLFWIKCCHKKPKVVE